MGEAIQLSVPGPHGPRKVRLSSPSRVLWPDLGVTKLDLAEYVIAVGEAFVAANGERPVSLERYPDGVGGESFFSKNPPRGAPAWARSVTVTYPSARAHPQLVIDEVATAVWAVQMNTVVFHPWPSRAGASDFPDQLRVDLDPQPGTDFADAVPAARELERRMPDAVTTSWWKEERGEKVFADFNQANRDRTIAGAYSPRALPHAPVSTPVTWEELGDVDPREFTVRTVPERLRTAGDPWAHMHDEPGSIATLLEWWERDLRDGLGELPFPPDYPKMPGEPPRVQPSRARKD